jgi:hypothetical protein
MKKPARTPKTPIQRRATKRPPGLKIKTKVRAAGSEMQHNQTNQRSPGLKIKTKVRAAGSQLQHNQTLTRIQGGSR